MVRRSTPQAVLAQRFFPVRVRILVPPDGFGMQLDRFCAWLDAHIGRKSYWIGSDAAHGRDTALFYFLDVDAARSFLDRFACGAVLRDRGREEDRPA
jgi:hypothetical protein